MTFLSGGYYCCVIKYGNKIKNYKPAMRKVLLVFLCISLPCFGIPYVGIN